MNKIEGKLTLNNQKIAIITARFNEFITAKLLSGAMDTLNRHGLAASNITEIWVPGAYELPWAAKQVAKTGHFDAIICLGCVIRGATTHYDYVCNEAAKGIAQVSMDYDIPVGFGVVTTENIEQAVERSGTKAGNKGVDTAMCVIEMINLAGQLKEL